MKSAPRVLVVSHNCFSQVYNNGKTLESIFSGFPKEHIAQLFFHTAVAPDFGFCSRYFRITDYDILHSLLGRQSSGPVRDSAAQEKPIEKKLRAASTNAGCLYPLLLILRDLLWRAGRWDSEKLRHWLQAQRPDLVFFVGGNSGFSHRVARRLSAMLHIPLCVFFTDDYLICPRHTSLCDVVQRSSMKKFYTATVRQASLCFAIGDLMCQEYSRFFNKPFHAIMNSVVLKPYTPPAPGSQITISFFGGLHLNRWQMLVRFGGILSRLKPRLNADIMLRVYCMQRPEPAVLARFEKCGITYAGGVAGDALDEALQRSSILLHVESDDAYNRSLTRLSVSTKIPEYLMAGRPVIGFGPAEVASMRLLSDHGIGLVLSSDLEDAALEGQLADFLAGPASREQLAQKGHAYAAANFDNQQIAQKFMAMLASLQP